MEILTAIIPTIIDYTVRALGRQVRYVIFCKSNLKDLRSALKKFNEVKQRMNHEVDEVERKVDQQVEADVRNWQTEADEISREAEALLHDEGHAKTKCLIICPNLIYYHQRSRKSTKLMEKIEAHENKKKEFSSVSYKVPVEDVSALASDEYMAFESRTSMVKDIITELKKPDINKIGVYGLPGVGKTTLAKEVYREAVKEKLFDDVVIILNVKEKEDNEKIHKEITETLGMDIDESENMGKRANLLWEQGREEKLFDDVVRILNLKGKIDNETIQKAITKKLSMDVDESKDMGTRANLLRARIKDGKTLVILDDVLERIDFEAMGLVGVPTCNLLVTSRDQTVLSGMGMQKCFQLGLLSEEETWRLFEKMAGDVVKDDRIRKVATQVARRCGGLPVSVVTVARASREDSCLEVWKDALRRFKSFDKDGPAEIAKFAIKWSYNRLKGDELRPLFLLCGVIAGGSCSISLSDLFNYSMGLGLIKNVDTVEDARNSLHALAAKLKNSCLLLDSYNDSTVRMHEFVRDVAIWVACDDNKVFSKAYGDEVKEWPAEDLFKKYTMISLISCKIPRLPKVPWECPELKLLALENDDIGDTEEIPSKFFEGMKELKVLDVTKFSIQSLLPSLQSLKHLQTLCLDHCEMVDITLVGQLTTLKILSLLKSKITKLPKEIGQLTRLQLLDLTGCSELVLISPGVISSLTRLEDLRMGIKSFKQWEGEGPTSGGSNANISELKHLAELTALDIHVPDANLLPANLFSDKLERYTILIGDCWAYPDIHPTSSNMLELKLTRGNQFDRGIKLLVEKCEQLYLDGKESGNIIPFLFESDSVKQLKCLHVQNNDKVTYVVNSIDWSYSQNAFQKLKSLILWNLPKLIGFSSNDMKLTTDTDTEADEIVLEEEIGGPPKLFNNEKVMMPNLTTLIVHQCDSLRFLFSSSMAKCLRQLKILKISNCQIMEEIVGNEENTNDMFDKLHRLELQHLPNLVRFSSGSYIKFPSLGYLNLDDCTKLETFIFDAKSENITTNKEERDIELFDEKVGFPSLEMLFIWDIPNLKTIFHNQLHSDSFGKLIIMDVCRCHSLINIFGSSIMGRLNVLKSLKIEQCQSLQVVYDSSSTTQLNDFGTDADKIVLEEEVGGPPRLFSNGEVMMPNLTTLIVHQCDSLRFLFSSSMAKCLRQLKILKISNCQIMEEIVRNEENTDDMFDKLHRLELQHLPNLARFSSRSYIKFPSLVYLDLVDCTKLETFIFDAKSENITTNKEERNIELFDEKVGFPSLEMLCIWDIPNLKTIFHNQLHSDSFGKLIVMDVRRCHSLINIFGSSIMGRLNALESLKIEQCQSLQVVYDSSSTTQLNSFDCPNLNSVEICSCESLKNVFPASVAKDLKQLSKFSINNCGLMEAIVVKEEGPQMAYEEFEFPKVTTMIFDNIPQLRSFYPGLHVSNWPSLNTLKFIRCGGVKIFAAEFSRYQDKFKLGHPMPTEQPFFLIEKGKSFLNLEVLILDKNMEIWYEPYGPLPTELLSKLNTICFATSHPKSDVFFENLQNIEMLVVCSAPWKELFVHDHQGSSRGETLEVETLPRVKVLQLTKMPELIHLGMENSQPGGPVFPNLEVLCLKKCGRLENLASTLIPFRNLIFLTIQSCHGLQYLIPYSVAKNLQQLLRLEVVSCQRMVEIVASKEDDPENEITFSCLQCLKLSGLPSLQGFCRGNCIFKVPSFKTLFVEDCQLIDLKISSDGLLQSDPRPGRLQIAK